MATSYLPATRHPWPCLLFVLPLLIAYEACVVLFGGAHPETLRNGADNWLRDGFGAVGLKFFWIPPLLLVLVFALWSYLKRGEKHGRSRRHARRHGHRERGVRPGPVGRQPGAGAAAEIGRHRTGCRPRPRRSRRACSTSFPMSARASTRRRCFASCCSRCWRGCFAAWNWRGRWRSHGGASRRRRCSPRPTTSGRRASRIATITFLFRLVAGLYFAGLFQYRGFGIAVGAHACYNLMVGISDG